MRRRTGIGMDAGDEKEEEDEATRETGLFEFRPATQRPQPASQSRGPIKKDDCDEDDADKTQG